jgi:inner membrane protein COX18
MIITTLCTRQISVRRLIDCRHLSYYNTNRPILSSSLFCNKNNTSEGLHIPNRSVSSVTTITLPSWFVTLSNSTPVAYAQQFIISFHEMTGTSWWATIMLSAITLRLVVTLPLTIYQVGTIIVTFLYFKKLKL